MDQVRNTSKTSWIKTNFTWWLLIAIGIALRLRQYLANRSFWADEASLALNIVGRSFSGLTLPLDYEQGTPILFLLIEKLSIVVQGTNDFILRLFPLLAGLLSV